MAGKPPPKAPVPIVGNVTHFSIELNWGEFVDRLKEVYTKEDGKIIIEIQHKSKLKAGWDNLYTGYDKRTMDKNLEPETTYSYRMRFKNKHGWGDLSKEIDVTTIKQPMTGEHIHKAIRLNDEVELLKVLEKGEACIEAQDKLGFTPLMASCQAGKLNIAKVLIEWKADLEAKNDSGKTALMLAAFKGQNDCVELLLDAGAQMDNQDRNGLAALHYAVDGEHSNTIKLLLNHGADVNQADTEMGWTPLIRCGGLKNNGNPTVTWELVRNGAKVDMRDKNMKTALHIAVMNGHHKMVDLLLQEGADPMLVTEQKYNALDLAESMDNRYVKSVIAEHLQKKGIEEHDQQRIKKFLENVQSI